MSQWGPTGSKMGKDPKKKSIPKEFTKKRTNTDPKPYMKIMSRRGA